MVLSVHLEKFPKLDINIEEEIVKKMDEVREICNCVASLRKEANLRVRMPLKKVTICGKNDLDDNYLDLIKQEANVHDIEIFNDDIDKIAQKEIILNMKECGKIFGSKLKEIMTAQKEKQWEIVDNKLHIANEVLDDSLFSILYKTKSGTKATQCKSFNLLIMIDTELTEELIIEGLARDITRVIQQTRKEKNLDISDRIDVVIQTKDAIFDKVFEKWKEYIQNQTLANTINIENTIDENNIFEVDGYKFSVSISKSN